MESTLRSRPCLGMDVGKRSHWACLVSEYGEIVLNRPVLNTEEDLDALFASIGKDTLLVVDQVRNIGSLPISRARLAGIETKYLPGTAMHEASRLFAGDAKTDERDALVIAKTAIGIPDALLPTPIDTPDAASARIMAAQREHLLTSMTRDKNRIRSILLESCPKFETLVNLADLHIIHALAELGGPWGIHDAGKAAFGAVTRGANRTKMDELWESVYSSTRPAKPVINAENCAIKHLARMISINAGEVKRITARMEELLSTSNIYQCLLTVPGIGPRTAAELTISIDINEFRSHNNLASYCGLAPRNRQSGTSISSVSASRQGNKRLKNLLIFSCNSLIKTSTRFGEYYRQCRNRGMSHNKALKATARKRLKVIYAVMRDEAPYVA